MAARAEPTEIARDDRSTRDVENLQRGAGRHQIRLDGGASLAAGAYVMQITQGGRMVTRRGVIVR